MVSTPGFPVLHYLPEFAQTHVHWVGDDILCHPLLLLPSVFPSNRVFSKESTLPIRWPKYWSFSFSISPSNEYSGLISFQIDWFDLLGVQRTLKSLLQHHNLKASILQHSAVFMVQLAHPYMTMGKTIALTIQTFVSRAMSLLLNMLSRFVIAFLPSSTCLLIYQTSFYQTPKKRCILLLGQHEPRVIEIMKVEKMRALSTECFQRVKIGLYAGDGHPLSCYE